VWSVTPFSVEHVFRGPGVAGPHWNSGGSIVWCFGKSGAVAPPERTAIQPAHEKLSATLRVKNNGSTGRTGTSQQQCLHARVTRSGHDGGPREPYRSQVVSYNILRRNGPCPTHVSSRPFVYCHSPCQDCPGLQDGEATRAGAEARLNPPRVIRGGGPSRSDCFRLADQVLQRLRVGREVVEVTQALPGLERGFSGPYFHPSGRPAVYHGTFCKWYLRVFREHLPPHRRRPSLSRVLVQARVRPLRFRILQASGVSSGQALRPRGFTTEPRRRWTQVGALGVCLQTFAGGGPGPREMIRRERVAGVDGAISSQPVLHRETLSAV